MIRVRITVPRHLLVEIDQLVGRGNRNAFIVQATPAKVERERFAKALAETKGILAAEDHPEWSTPEKTSAWVRELRAVDNEAANSKLARRE
jgi:metal-responsive CopG/Arc/MetJ family transcriptional regulator